MKRGTTPEKRAQMLRAAAQRIGLPGYVAILASVRDRAMSTTELAEKHGVSRLLVLAMMRHCLRAKVVHRCDWFRPAPHARMVPMWRLGAEGDVSMPQYEEHTRRPRRAPSMLILLTTVIDLLKYRPHTRAELAEELKMHVESACRVLDLLRCHGLVHIASWYKPPVGTSVAEFAFGPGVNKPRPPHTSKAVYFRGYRARQKQLQTLHLLAGSPAAMPKHLAQGAAS